MYSTTEQQNRDTKKYNSVDSELKLGKVTEVTAQHLPKVQINGASEGSTKVYPCVNSYWPQVNDVVLLAKNGLTYIVIGAIEDEVLTTMWALANHTHEGYAAAGHVHGSLTDADGSSQYGGISFNRSTGQVGYNQITASQTYQYNANVAYGLIPSDARQTLGWSSNHWAAAFINHIRATDIGSSASILDNVWSNFFMGKYIGKSANKFTSGYITTIYGTVSSSSSDRRIKKDIKPLSERFRAFFRHLKPCSFKFTLENTDDKEHFGFIAQEVEEALSESGIENAGLVNEDDSGIKYLNYTEFIALQTQAIQDLQERVETLERKIKEMENDGR